MKALAHRLRGTKDHYRPSKLGKDEIRLVKVLPTPGDIIDCSVWHAQQSSTSLTYTCLSYRCGEPQDGSKLIRVNGKLHRVLINLWNFLDLARRTLTNEALWIDALCINQRDSREKATQVSRMGIIYTNCTRTRIWLGHAPNAEQLYADSDDSDDPEQRALSPDLTLITRIIGDNPYWTRAWIVQEVLLSPHRIIHISGVSMEWELLQSLYYHLSLDFSGRAPRPTHEMGRKLQGTYYLSDVFGEAEPFLRKLREGNVILKSESLRELLEDHRFTHCTLWQDQIFALLPLCAGGARFTVDYNASRYELFFESLRSFNHDQCLCWARVLANVLGVDYPPVPISSLDSRKLTRPFLEVRIYADNIFPDDPQAQKDRLRHRIDLKKAMPFDAELEIELGSRERLGSRLWCCKCIYAYGSGLRRLEPLQIADSTTCSSIKIFQPESTPGRATPFVVRISQLAFLHLIREAPYRLHKCSSYLWNMRTIRFCT